jgi:hypothetical protein
MAAAQELVEDGQQVGEVGHHGAGQPGLPGGAANARNVAGDSGFLPWLARLIQRLLRELERASERLGTLLWPGAGWGADFHGLRLKRGLLDHLAGRSDAHRHGQRVSCLADQTNGLRRLVCIGSRGVRCPPRPELRHGSTEGDRACADKTPANKQLRFGLTTRRDKSG